MISVQGVLFFGVLMCAPTPRTESAPKTSKVCLTNIYRCARPKTEAPTSSIRARSFCLCREVECSRLRFFYLICSPFCIPPSLFCWNQSLFCGRCRRVVLLMYLRLSVLMLCARLRSQIFADCDQRCRPLSVLRSW